MACRYFPAAVFDYIYEIRLAVQMQKIAKSISPIKLANSNVHIAELCDAGFDLHVVT